MIFETKLILLSFCQHNKLDRGIEPVQFKDCFKHYSWIESLKSRYKFKHKGVNDHIADSSKSHHVNLTLCELNLT